MAEYSRDDYLFMARTAAEADRFEDSASFVDKAIAAMPPGEDLTLEERNVLSFAYKHAIGHKRAAWRIITIIERKEAERGLPERVAMVQDYRTKIEADLDRICNGILHLLNDRLIPTAVEKESKVYFYKLKGDYLRYRAEYKVGKEKMDTAMEMLGSYMAAEAIALEELPPTHNTRLGLYLNYSVCYYEILDCPQKAIALATQAVDAVMVEVNGHVEELEKDIAFIVKLLRDNLMQWNKEQDEAADAVKEAPKHGEETRASQ